MVDKTTYQHSDSVYVANRKTNFFSHNCLDNAGNCLTFASLKKISFHNMLIINIKEDESIDRALKRYKRKYQLTGVINELRRRKNFTKPSVERRNEILNAQYRLQKYGSQD